MLWLKAAGSSVKSIARRIGRSRATVRYWLRRGAGVAQSEEATALKAVKWGFESPHQHQSCSYAYLLGMYLGDGYIAKMPRTHVLRIFLNEKQAAVADRVRRAIDLLLPTHRAGVFGPHRAVLTVTSSFKDWPEFLPQHGRGRKHLRKIALQPWQAEIVAHHPEECLRGLLESDGSRHRRLVNGRDYPAHPGPVHCHV